MSINIPGFGCRRSNVYDPFSFQVWNPFKDFQFESAFSGHTSLIPNETLGFINAKTDWKETPEAHVFTAELPGLKKDEVKVLVEEDRVLKISGERNVEKEERDDQWHWHRVERSSGKFMRMFRLPENARVHQLKASMQDGLLTVTVPKEEVKKPRLKTVQIS